MKKLTNDEIRQKKISDFVKKGMKKRMSIFDWMLIISVVIAGLTLITLLIISNILL